MKTRHEILRQLFPKTPLYRMKQVDESLFKTNGRSWESVSVLPKAWRESIAQENLPWLSLREVALLSSRRGDTYKALLETSDRKRIETVLMKNTRGFWSICVSSQVGCAMACTFCATGKMGFVRNLTADEIIDQYRYWLYFLDAHGNLDQQISNIVYMGMGEPLANYENVKYSLQSFLTYTVLGPTRLTISTVGLLPRLKQILSDESWPPVRLAVSLHSADPETRKSIMPTSYPEFLDHLAEWTDKYFQKFDSRRRHLTFEYIMLSGVNDTQQHAEKLIKFARRIGKVKINLIPYNDTESRYTTSENRSLRVFEEKLRVAGIDVTRRRTMGSDIMAACGQLIVKDQKQ